MMAELAVTLKLNPLQLAVRLELFPNRHDERRRKLALSADQNHLIHKTRCFDRLLDWLWRDILTTRSLKQFLLAIRDAQESILVQRADISGLEPAIAGEDCARLFGLVVITAHYIWTTHFD